MNRKQFLTFVGLIAALLSPLPAYAHVGHGQTSGLLAGFLHPLAGIDHLAAMIAVGLWAAQLGGRAIWAAPLSFVAVMSLGGIAGAYGVHLPFVEPAILSSVLVLGLLVAFAVRLPVLAISLIAGLFALFHGHAHGSEMPGTISGVSYGFGFVLVTAALHGLGAGFGLFANHFRPYAIRYAGGLVTAVGVYLVLA